MNIPDRVHLYSTEYSGLCFNHAVKQVMENDLAISMCLEEDENECACDLCEEIESIEDATRGKHKVIWTRQMVKDLPRDTKIELFIYERYNPKGKRFVPITIKCDKWSEYYQIDGESRSYYNYGKVTSTLKWLNENQVIRAEDKDEADAAK